MIRYIALTARVAALCRVTLRLTDTCLLCDRWILVDVKPHHRRHPISTDHLRKHPLQILKTVPLLLKTAKLPLYPHNILLLKKTHTHTFNFYKM